ncbi:site-2 protease family protein [Haladaptatus sp. ZSTT2]|uniref:site-2 protease family protein n=1 Tax=Haladaptatus sp. ZSTT2 TaxID=3120515 RepID=UPI00300F4D3B
MDTPSPPADGPPVDAFSNAFHVYETRTDGTRLFYYGVPLDTADSVERQLWPLFRDHGYEVTLTQQTGEHVLVAEPHTSGSRGFPWTNVLMALLTILSTLYAGTAWYYIDITQNPLDLVQALPFALAILGVLGVHEFGHYAMSRYHGVDASLPYFIPFPTLIGTMGAVIRMRGRMPDRKALFDIGVAGPLAGLVAAAVVTIIGLYMDPVTAPAAVLNDPGSVQIRFNNPLILELIATAVGRPLEYADPAMSVNPVVMGGWVGFFVTFLNLLPVGQLDGGHLVRSMLGERQETLAALVPAVLFGLAGYLYYFHASSNAAGIWFFWGLFSMGIAYAGPAHPVHDDPLDTKRIAIGVLTFVLGLLCFTPVPIEFL